MVDDEIKGLKMKKNRKNKNEMHAIRELENKKGIVIRTAYIRGGGVSGHFD